MTPDPTGTERRHHSHRVEASASCCTHPSGSGGRQIQVGMCARKFLELFKTCSVIWNHLGDTLLRIQMRLFPEET